MIGEWLSNVNVSLGLSILVAILSSPLIRLFRWLEKFEGKLKESAYSLSEMRMAFRKRMLFYPLMIALAWALLLYFFLPFAVFATWAKEAFQQQSSPYETNLAIKGMGIFACWLVVFGKVGWGYARDRGEKKMEKISTDNMEYMEFFPSNPNDELWKFKIKDLFPHTDKLARHVLMVLTANEDLSNIERLKDLLERDSPRPGVDDFAQIKRNRSQFFLNKLRLGFLYNVWKDILEEGRDTSSIAEAISELGSEVTESYEEFRKTIFSCRRTKNILGHFRNRTSFHYDQKQIEKALEIGAEDTGEIIVGDLDTHFIVAYQALDLIPAGRPSPEEVSKIKDEMELIQDKFHAFVGVLFPAYIQSRSLKEKVEITRR